jgi:hypothetical protein
MFAPLVLVISFALWMALLALAFGLLAHALREDFRPPLDGFAEAVYAVGSALVTVGQGHGGVTGAARWVVLAAGFCGLAVMTMAVTYLLEVQSSIARRDAGILKLRTSAGDPPTALALLEKFEAIGARGELARVLRDGRDWCAAVRQSHTSHPSLIYFRTIGTGSGWPAALGALLDLAFVVERWIEAPDLAGLAILLREDGRRMAEDLGRLIDLDREPEAPDAAGTREMDRRLAAAGYERQARFDADAFAADREGHATWIRALGHHLGRHPGGLLPSKP